MGVSGQSTIIQYSDNYVPHGGILCPWSPAASLAARAGGSLGRGVGPGVGAGVGPDTGAGLVLGVVLGVEHPEPAPPVVVQRVRSVLAAGVQPHPLRGR